MSAKADGRPAQRVVEKGIPLLDCMRFSGCCKAADDEREYKEKDKK